MGSFRTTLASDVENRNRLLALQNDVPKRKCHEPTQLGCVRRSAIPFMAYIDRRCPPPIHDGVLNVTREWTLGCFLPAYQAARTRNRNDPDAIVADITDVLISRWVSTPRPTVAAQELERRVRLAVAVLLRQDGHDVSMPVEPGYPSPSVQMHPAWIRSLMNWSARMTIPMKIPKSKTALLAIRQCGQTYEAFDSEGVSLGTARNPVELWTLLGLAMDSVHDEIELPKPEQVALENMVRETGATIGNYIEKKHPGTMGLFKTFLRGATIARQKGYFED